jgi:hypothetical protein
MEKTWSLLKWLIALFCPGIFSLVIFWSILTGDWDFDTTPPWAWTIIPIVPFVGTTLLFLPIERSAIATRLSLSLVVLHAAIMLGLLVSGKWPSVAVTALILDAVFIATLLYPAIAGRGPGRLAKATIVWLALFFGMGFILALANGVVVTWRAENLAGERPYCIQYASQTDAYAYEPARTLFDLSLLKMQARIMAGGSSLFHFQNHAVLTIDDGSRSFFNWSYGQEGFLDEALNRNTPNGEEVFCRPERHFAKHLPIWHHDASPTEMSISARHFVIPEAYRPRANGNKIIINAVPPDFAPYSVSNKSPLYPAQFYSDIVVAGIGDLSAALKRRLDSGEAKPIGPEFGLDKTQLYFLPNRRTASTLYTGSNSSGHLTELIDCGPNDFRAVTCRFQFEDGGLVFSLRISDPSQWLTIEQRLRSILASFEGHR